MSEPQAECTSTPETVDPVAGANCMPGLQPGKASLEAIKNPPADTIPNAVRTRDTQDIINALEDRVAKLDALEAAGVDNWEGYDDAMEILNGVS